MESATVHVSVPGKVPDTGPEGKHQTGGEKFYGPPDAPSLPRRPGLMVTRYYNRGNALTTILLLSTCILPSLVQ